MSYLSETCPNCGSTVKLPGSGEIGVSFECVECSRELEIVWANPIRIMEFNRNDDYLIDSAYMSEA